MRSALRAASTALLIMDVQLGIVDRYASDEGYLARLATAITVMVTKRRVSAFTGSDLEVLLRSGGIDSLVLAGIATSGVVLSTLRQAADLDYRLTVLADGCLDADPEVHQVLLGKLFPRQAEVTSVAEWAASLRRG
jgi:nicotinamidase-related amidase